MRTLVMLQDPTLAPRLVKHLQGKAPMEERIQAAMLARFLDRRLDARAAQRAAGLFQPWPACSKGATAIAAT